MLFGIVPQHATDMHAHKANELVITEYRGHNGSHKGTWGCHALGMQEIDRGGP